MRIMILSSVPFNHRKVTVRIRVPRNGVHCPVPPAAQRKTGLGRARSPDGGICAGTRSTATADTTNDSRRVGDGLCGGLLRKDRVVARNIVP